MVMAAALVRGVVRASLLQRRSISLSLRAGQEFCAALAFDLETTGLDVNHCEIVQIAIVVANSQRGARFSRLVLPDGDIDPQASAVHGLTRDSLEAAGATPFAEVWQECEAWLDETMKSSTRPLVWAAHNGNRFDRPILLRCVDRATGGSACLRSPRASWIDTLSLARSALPGRRWEGSQGPYTLGRLYEDASGRSLDGAHDALADAEALAVVWKCTRPSLPTTFGPPWRPAARRMPHCVASPPSVHC